MLLQSVKATNAQGSVLDLPLEDISGGFSVRNIDGLGPVKATLVSSSFANMDGEQYHSSRRDSRNILATLGLEPDYAIQGVQALRSQLQQYFMPKSEVTLTFRMFDKFSQSVVGQYLDLDIVGRVESFDSPLFTNDPKVDLSIMCYDPDFYDPNEIEVDGTTVADLTTFVVSYAGTVDTGVVFQLRPDRAVSDFTIYHQPPDGSLRTFDFSYPLQAGDVLEISSVPGSKYATLTRAGTSSSVLYGLSPQAGWLALQPGDNTLRVYATGAAMPFNVVYTNKYGAL